MRVPSSTYRLQFHRDFTLVDAQGLTDYLAELGITDLYASPLLRARKGSTHGYDVTDPTAINPEIGSYEDLRSLSCALQTRNMGLLLDIVPNHMAASLENPWWSDLLQHGEVSRYAHFFDVDWSRKLLLPVLEKPYGDALESGELRIHTAEGRSSVAYNGHTIPMTIPSSREDGTPSDLSNPEALDRVLAAQPYRLAHWRKASDAINYRRFFDVSDLVSLKAEEEDVFQATHGFILDLLRTGVVSGLRIDHIDGLRDPQSYLEKLPSVYVIVEKILSGNEQLPCSWRVWGTTGYDFLNIVNGLFVERRGYEELKNIYATFTRSAATLIDIFPARKRQVMETLFIGEVRALLKRLLELADEDRRARDLTLRELEEAFIDLTAFLPVYRTYLRACGEVSETDRYHIEDAIAAASRINPSPAYGFLRSLLLADPPPYLEHRRCEWLDFAMKWQQFSGPVMAKGLEDTAFYVYNPLVSLNEVGGDPAAPETYFGVDEFHRRMHDRRARWPFTLNAGSTHDTKRSEDARARINVLSEIPMEWNRHLKKWARLNSTAEQIPDRNEEILIYQSMLGAWPVDAIRLKAYVTKALREAKLHTSWLKVNEAYERRVLEFVDRILDPERSREFLEDFSKMQKKTAFYGAISSLAQTVLRMTAPGVPDFYQGQEVWDYSLADPDNRRPVDFAARVRMLDEIKAGVCTKDLLEGWTDGRLKMFVIWKTLNFRRHHSDLFLRGDYIPLRIIGERADHLIAFARRYRNEWSVTVVPRLVASFNRSERWPLGLSAWVDTTIEFAEACPTDWTNVLTGETSTSPTLAAQVLGSVPVAVLHGSIPSLQRRGGRDEGADGVVSHDES